MLPPSSAEILQALAVLSAVGSGVAGVAAWSSARTASSDLRRRLEEDARRKANRRSVVVAELGRLRLALGDVPPSESFLRQAMDKRLIPPAFMPWVQALFPDFQHDLPSAGALLANVEHHLATLRDRRVELDAAERRIGAARDLLAQCSFHGGQLTNIPSDVRVSDVTAAQTVVQNNAGDQWEGMDRAWQAATAAIDRAIAALTEASAGR